MIGVDEQGIVRAVADTHAVLWYLFEQDRLSESAHRFMETIDVNGDFIAFSSITLVEVLYLCEKGRLPVTFFTNLIDELESGVSCFVEAPLNREVAQSMQRVPRGEVPDMPDRIIAATAVALDVPLISRDHKITLSRIRTIW